MPVVKWYEHPDFIGMVAGMFFGFILLVVIPIAWVPLSLSPIWMPSHRMDVTECSEQDGSWYILSRFCHCKLVVHRLLFRFKTITNTITTLTISIPLLLLLLRKVLHFHWYL